MAQNTMHHNFNSQKAIVMTMSVYTIHVGFHLIFFIKAFQTFSDVGSFPRLFDFMRVKSSTDISCMYFCSAESGFTKGRVRISTSSNENQRFELIFRLKPFTILIDTASTKKTISSPGFRAILRQLYCMLKIGCSFPEYQTQFAQFFNGNSRG